MAVNDFLTTFHGNDWVFSLSVSILQQVCNDKSQYFDDEGDIEISKQEIKLTCPSCYTEKIFYCVSRQKSVWFDCPSCEWCGYPINYIFDKFEKNHEAANTYLSILKHSPIRKYHYEIADRNIEFFRKMKKLKKYMDHKIYFTIREDWQEHNPPYWWCGSKVELENLEINVNFDERKIDGCLIIPSYDGLDRIVNLEFYRYNPIGNPEYLGRLTRQALYQGLKFRLREKENSIFDYSVLTTDLYFACNIINTATKNNISIPPIICCENFRLQDIPKYLADLEGEKIIIIYEPDVTGLIEKAVLFGLSSRLDFKIFRMKKEERDDTLRIRRGLFEFFFDQIHKHAKPWEIALLEELAKLSPEKREVLLECLDRKYISEKVSNKWSREKINQYLKGKSFVNQISFRLTYNWTIKISGGGLVRQENNQTVCPYIPTVTLLSDGKRKWTIFWQGNVIQFETSESDGNDIVLNKIETEILNRSPDKIVSETHPFIVCHLYSIARHLSKYEFIKTLKWIG